MNNKFGYDELLKKYKEILEENNKLKIENQKLKKLLEGINNTSSIKNSSLSDSLSNYINDREVSISFHRTNSFELKEFPFPDISFHFICQKCHKVPLIEFNSLTAFNYSCTCLKNQNIILKDIIKEYIEKENEENEEDVSDNNNTEKDLKCQIHNENYAYYCKYDYLQLCRSCIKQNNIHQFHPLYNFDCYFFEINQKKELIDEILNRKQKEINIEMNDAKQLSKLFSVISNDFILYPNYSHFVIIEKALTFLEQFISNKNNNEIIESLNFQRILVINNKKMLYENMINANIIIEIDIKNSNLNDITQLCELDLVNLEKLYLSENSISNVEPLLRAKFKKLKHLDFGRNKIDDENISYLLEMQFDQLEEINLYSNSLTDVKIFELQNNQNLPKLKTFYIGNNKIDWAKRNSIGLKYNFKKLTTIGLTCGLFDDYTIKNINSFNLSSLKIIYLSKCDFHSLYFVEFLELPLVEEFYINISFINEFFPLNKYKSLKIIEMRENFIENIDKLEEFINSLPNLIQFNILENNINMNLEKNKNIIEAANNIRINLDIMINI